MCGIAGIVAFTETGKDFFSGMESAIACLGKRGPDASGIFAHNKVVLGHTRLSVIDTSASASQPMTDASGRYTIIFNGEFFNFKEHREFVLQSAIGAQLKSGSDTEILLYLYMLEKEKCLERVNGFFALAIYDRVEETLFLARDRFGVKPLLIYRDDDKLFFASEMKVLMALGIPKNLDEVSLFTYLQLNYIPGPDSIFKNVKKLEPGHFLKVEIRNQESETVKYYSIPFPTPEYIATASTLPYETQQKKLFSLLEASVHRRLVSDVPLGAFLSGGIDSSIVVALASQHTSHLKTFSIGFRDEPMFDETRYANLVVKKFNTDHTVFSLTTDDLLADLFEALDYIDEPFADSSLLPVHILSKHTRKQVKVALSGDGADELFGGYNKHAAELRVRNNDPYAKAIKLLSPLWKILPQSRNSTMSNRVRQFNRFATGMKLPAKERYWRWAGFEDETEVKKMLSGKGFGQEEYLERKKEILKYIREDGNINDVLYTDMHVVLPGDMLTKIDLMSMANSLEVRTPFLDYEVVNFAFSLPVNSKISERGRKLILRDAFRNILPEELYTRRKQGFEMPLLKWFRGELKSLITEDLLSEKLIREQNIFHYPAIQQLKKKLFSMSPGETVDQVWALIVFQYWWKRNVKIQN